MAEADTRRRQLIGLGVGKCVLVEYTGHWLSAVRVFFGLIWVVVLKWLPRTQFTRSRLMMTRSRGGGVPL